MLTLFYRPILRKQVTIDLLMFYSYKSVFFYCIPIAQNHSMRIHYPARFSVKFFVNLSVDTIVKCALLFIYHKTLFLIPLESSHRRNLNMNYRSSLVSPRIHEIRHLSFYISQENAFFYYENSHDKSTDQRTKLAILPV